MILLILIGLFAVIAGKISLAKDIYLTGKNARIYGSILIVLAVPFNFVTAVFLVNVLPASISSNLKVMLVVTVVLLLGIIFGVAIPFKEKQDIGAAEE